MSNTLLLVAWGCCAVLGGTLVSMASELSAGYNNWTTSLRTRHSTAGPPTPKWRERNTKIMTWIIRLFGGTLMLVSALWLISLLK
jgi:hypothetical protein